MNAQHTPEAIRRMACKQGAHRPFASAKLAVDVLCDVCVGISDPHETCDCENYRAKTKAQAQAVGQKFDSESIEQGEI